jgi:hypothetical protein
MCRNLYIGGHDPIDTVGKLRPLMPAGLASHVYPNGKFFDLDKVPDVVCLCPIDIKATAKLNSYRYRMDDRGSHWLSKESL